MHTSRSILRFGDSQRASAQKPDLPLIALTPHRRTEILEYLDQLISTAALSQNSSAETNLHAITLGNGKNPYTLKLSGLGELTATRQDGQVQIRLFLTHRHRALAFEYTNTRNPEQTVRTHDLAVMNKARELREMLRTLVAPVPVTPPPIGFET